MRDSVRKEVEKLIKELKLNCSVEEFHFETGWRYVCKHQNLSEDFIREFSNKVNWYFISKCQKLSESFIREFKNKVKWNNISIYQKLSEDFIREFKDYVDWDYISQYQNLSKSFIREFKDYVVWGFISKHQKLSKKFRKEFKIKIAKDNWLYKSVKFKLKKLKELGLYEIVDNKYIVAFKSIRTGNYSHFNFQYKYEVGKTYKSNCDCNVDNENSFGLSAWIMEKAEKFRNYNYKIIKVRIPISKLGAIVCEGCKLRCFEFEVVEEIK